MKWTFLQEIYCEKPSVFKCSVEADTKEEADSLIREGSYSIDDIDKLNAPDVLSHYNLEKTPKTDNGFFKITSVHRDDIKGLGFDVSKVTDWEMERLAEKMANAYCNETFWIDLEILAEEYTSAVKKEKNDDN